MSEIEITEENKSLVNSRTCFYFTCKSCGKIVHRKGQHFDGRLLCQNCKKKETFLKKYGVDNPAKSPEIKSKMSKAIKESFKKNNSIEKIKETSLKKYGTSNPGQSDIAKEKRKKTIKEKYGESPLCKKDVIEKRKKTCKEKYGVEFPLSSKEFQKDISRNQFTSENNPMNNKESIQKRKNTVNKKYNGEVLANSEIRKKIKETNKEKYGDEEIFRTNFFKEKSLNTFIINHPNTTLSEWRALHRKQNYIFNSEKFDSSWEIALFIFAIDHNIDIQREPVKLTYIFNGDTKLYFPDFRYNGKLIELKGDQFFKEDGSMQNPYNHEQDDLYEAKHQCGLKNNVEFWTSKEMSPILEYINSHYTKDFLKLFNTKIEFPFPNQDLKDDSDKGLIQHFHKSIYFANRDKKKSPFEAWNDKSLVLKSALNRLKYIGKCEPKDILAGFNIAKIAPKVSVFSPYLATNLIKKYLNSYNEIFDPFSGFSGRMIGAINNNKSYIGQDINLSHIEESNSIITYKNYQNCKVSQKNIFLDKNNTYECLFTCPPYGKKEHWNENDKILSCDEWIDICLKKYNCKAYLFVVDFTEKYKSYIQEEILNSSHLNKNTEKVVLIENNNL